MRLRESENPCNTQIAVRALLNRAAADHSGWHGAV